MATATAPNTRSSPSAANAPRHAHPIPQPTQPSQRSQPSLYAVEVERDEAWVRQLQEQQNQRFAQQAELAHQEFLQELSRAGPFAGPETTTRLQARYTERLDQMRAMQQEELEQLIEMERQERLWSLGLQDESWEGMVRQEQFAILANIKRDSEVDDANLQERIRENAREAEDVGRRSEEWQRTEPQRVLDRGRWAERTRLTNFHVEERRQRDIAEAESQAAHQRAREAQLRENLAAQLDSTPSSRPDGLSSANSTTSVDSPPSSVNTDRQRPSPAISIPTAADDTRRASPVDDARRSSPARPSPLSNTPTSHTMAYAKGEEVRVWIPPEGTRAPLRKGSTISEGREPARKQSILFDNREPGRKPSVQFGPPEDPVKWAYQSSPLPQAPSQPLPQPPNAPSMRTAPLPASQQSHSQPQPQPQQHQPAVPSAQPARTTAQPRPPAPPPTTPQPPRKQETTSPPRAAPLPTSTPTRPTPAQTTTRPAPTIRPTPAPAPTPAPTNTRQTPDSRPSPVPTNTRQTPDPRPTPAPTNTRQTPDPRPSPTSAAPGDRGAPPSGSDSAEERRRQLREEYVGTQAQRAEEELRRRREEENERRAEEARRRGAEKRRAEEEAREAERREAERREAERRARAGAGTSKAAHGPGKAVDMAGLWAAYESQWTAMASATQLRFRSIPWPVSTPVFEPAGLLPVLVASFVLSPAHSQGKARKDRLKEALLRWHPDRFETKWLHKVIEDEREIVKEGVGLIVRALNELLSAEGTFAG